MEEKEIKKPSYEELEQILMQRNHQINELYQALQSEQYTRACNTLSFYFEVIKNSAHFPVEYVDKVVEEVQKLLPVIPEETEENRDE